MEGFPWGGSEELWYRTALAAKAAGHDVQACVMNWKPEPPKVSELRKRNVDLVKREFSRISPLLKRVIKKGIGRELEFNNAHLNEIRRFSPDLVFISNGNTTDFFADHSFYKLVQELDRPYFLVSQFNSENGPPTRREIVDRIKNVRRLWHRYYFVSERNLATIERLMAYRLKNAVVIDNPVNIQDPGIAPWPDGNVLRIACVARFDTLYKGQDILLQTLAEPEFGSISFKLDFFGAGPDKEFIQNLIEFYGLSGKAEIVGHTSDIDQVWASHHVLVLPSIAEGTPLSLQECMLKGRPALVTDVGGNSSLIKDSINGFLAPVASVPYLKQSLLRLFNTPMSELKLMGERAFHHARSIIDPNPELRILAEMVESLEDNEQVKQQQLRSS